MFKTEINTNKLGCSVADGGREWAFNLVDADEDDPDNEDKVDKGAGQAMYGMLLSAQSRGQSVVVTG